MRICLLLGCQYWISEYTAVATEHSVNPSSGAWVKTVVAQLCLWLCAVGGTIVWFILPLCLDIEKDESPVAQGGKPKVTVIGFANSYGSAYLMVVLLSLALHFAIRFIKKHSHAVTLVDALLILKFLPNSSQSHVHLKLSDAVYQQLVVKV